MLIFRSPNKLSLEERMCSNAPDADLPTEPGGGGDGGPGLASPRMYSEVYFDSDSEEDTPSKNNRFFETTQLFSFFFFFFSLVLIAVCFFSFLSWQLHRPKAETANHTNQ